MANELTTKQDLAPRSEMATMFASLVELAKDPSVDAGKMTSLVELQMKMMDYSKQEEFNKAKIAAIMEMPSITKRGAIRNRAGEVQSRFSKFEDIHRVVKPILQRNNLAISFNVGSVGNQITVTPLLSHTNGHVEKGDPMALAVDTGGAKNATQGAGSAASYGKRYTMVAMLNIVEDGKDTDGVEMDPLEEDGRNAASCGSVAYAKWYSSLNTTDKAKIYIGLHDAFRALATEADKERGS